MSLFGFMNASGHGGAATLPKIDAQTASQWLAGKDCIFIDVREDVEYGSGHIPGAKLVPLSRFELALPGHRQGVKAVFYCLSGARTRSNAERLAAAGFSEAYILEGGLQAWKAQGAPTER